MQAEQETRKKQTAQELLHRAQDATKMTPPATMPSTADVSEALSRAGTALESQAQAAPDYKTKKVVTDMKNLVNTTEEMVVKKDLGDRLQKITKEAELASKEEMLPAAQGATSEARAKTREATGKAKSLAKNWAPLLRLTLSSIEFRRLVLDFIKISRAVFLRTVNAPEDIGERVESQWLKGIDVKDIATDVANKTKYNAKNEEGKVDVQMTDEEMDTLQEDLLETFSIIAKDPKYHEGVSALFDLGQMIYEETEKLSQEAENVANQPHMQKLKEETKSLIADFSGREALDRFLQSVRNLASSIRNDQEANAYISDVKSFILETRDPYNLRTEDFKQRSRDLVERGRRLQERLRNKSVVEEFLNAGDNLLNNIQNDQIISSLRESAGILVDDFTYRDFQGNLQLDTQMLGNIRKVIVPVLADALKYIPIPRLEDKNEKREYAVDNIVLCGYDIIPENIFVHLESDSWVNVKELETEVSHTSLVVSLRNFRTEIKDIKFRYKRLQFPQMEESGVVSFRIGGKGANLTLGFRIDQKPSDVLPKFTGGQVNFSISDMDIQFDRSTLTHDILVPMITSLWKRNLIHAIERAVEKNLGGVVNDIGKKMTESVGGWEPRFAQKLNLMTDTVKRGEFSSTYRARQDKLST